MTHTTRLSLLATLLLGGAMLFAACGKDDDPDPDPTPVTPPEPAQAHITDTIRYDNAHMTAYNFHYLSTDPYGNPVTLSGAITVGDEIAAAGNHARGMVLYNHFTVFRADQCPSRGDLGVNKICVGSGLICVAADYYGFGVTEDKPQAYCMPSTNAQASVDALLAARQLLTEMGYTWADTLFSAGYSQGGQTTVGVVKLISEKYPDIHLTYSFAGGGPYSIPETYRQFILSGESAMPSTVVSSLQTYNTFFNLGIPWEDIFREPVLSHLDEWLTSKRYTREQVDSLMGTNLVAEFGTEAVNNLESDISKRLMAAMETEDLTKGWNPPANLQMAIVHNSDDGAVPVANAEALVEFLRASGCTIQNNNIKDDGVYANIASWGQIPGIAPAHEWGAFQFLADVLNKIADVLGIEMWYTPSPSDLEGLLN